jgi:hypothetical protein
MAHFAEIENNIVTRVVVIHNNELLDENGIEQEANGIAFCQSHFGTTNWIQTSYNGNIRKNYASIGHTYDGQRDAFIPPKPYASWLLNEDTCQWVSPVPHPTDNKKYYWDEDTTSWVLSPYQERE